MKRLGLIGFAFCLVAVGQATPGQGAAGPLPPVKPGLPAPVLTLHDPAVQTELKPTHEQKVLLTQAIAEVDDALWLYMPFPNRHSNPADWQYALEEFQRIVGYGNERVKTILTADQSARLREIRVQLAGPWALLDAEVASDLGLTKEQSRKIARALAARQGKPDDRQIEAILDSEQRRTLRTLRGEPFVRERPDAPK